MCAGRPRSINSGNRTPKYSPSGTSPTSLAAQFPTSSCPYTKGAVMGGSAPKDPPTRQRNHRYNLFVPVLSSCPIQVYVQVPCNNQICPSQKLTHHRLHIQNCLPVSWIQITCDNVPSPPPHRQLACNDIFKVGGVLFKQRNAATVSAWLQCRYDTLTGRSAGVYSARKFYILKTPNIHVSLSHTP